MDDFQKAIQQGWQSHSENPQAVRETLKRLFPDVQDDRTLQSFTGLLLHVAGGHLNDWADCIDTLNKLQAQPAFAVSALLKRAKAIATYCASSPDTQTELESLPPDDLPKVYANACTELLANGDSERASRSFQLALEHCPPDIDADNPLARFLAVSGNNLAADLEENSNRSTVETELMLQAALVARKYWEIAGGWLETERAEYRLAMSHLQAGDLEKAEEHATLCEQICHENGSDPTELFFAHEALLKIQLAYCKHYQANVPEDMKPYCVLPSLNA